MRVPALDEWRLLRVGIKVVVAPAVIAGVVVTVLAEVAMYSWEWKWGRLELIEPGGGGG